MLLTDFGVIFIIHLTNRKHIFPLSFLQNRLKTAIWHKYWEITYFSEINSNNLFTEQATISFPMTSNYQRALYNGFKLKEQWKYEVDKYTKRIYIHRRVWRSQQCVFWRLNRIIRVYFQLTWILCSQAPCDPCLLTHGAPDQARHVTHGAPELHAAVPHVGGHPAAPAHRAGLVTAAPADPAHRLHTRLVPQRRQQPPQLPRLVKPH